MEFKGKFRLTYDLYKDLCKQGSYRYVVIIIAVIGIINFIEAIALGKYGYLVMSVMSLIFIFYLKMAIKKAYYDNIKEYMCESTITVSDEGIIDEDSRGIRRYSKNDVVKILETKKSFFIYVMNNKKAICMAKAQFENNYHINLLRQVITNCYTNVPTKLLYTDYEGDFQNISDMDIQDSDEFVVSQQQLMEESIITARNIKNNKKTVAMLYVFMFVAVILICMLPVRYKNRELPHNKENTVEEPEENSKDAVEKAIEMYVAQSKALIDLQEEYKTAEEHIEKVDDIYAQLSGMYEELDFYPEKRDAALVLLYELDSICYDVMYIMEEPYDKLGYIEKAEYDKKLEELKEYSEKLENLSGDNSGKI